MKKCTGWALLGAIFFAIGCDWTTVLESYSGDFGSKHVRTRCERDRRYPSDFECSLYECKTAVYDSYDQSHSVTCCSRWELETRSGVRVCSTTPWFANSRERPKKFRAEIVVPEKDLPTNYTLDAGAADSVSTESRNDGTASLIIEGGSMDDIKIKSDRVIVGGPNSKVEIQASDELLNQVQK